MRQLKKLRYQITKFGLLMSLIPFITLSVIGFIVAIQTLVNEQLNQLTTLVEAEESAAILYFEDHRIQARSFGSDGYLRTELENILTATSSSIQNQSSKKLQEYLLREKMVLNENILSIEILNMEGRVVAATYNFQEADRSNKDYYKRAIHTYETGVDNLLISHHVMSLEKGSLLHDVHNETHIREYGQEGEYPLDETNTLHTTAISLVTPFSESTTPLGFLVINFKSDDLTEILQGLHISELGNNENYLVNSTKYKELDIYLVDYHQHMITAPHASDSDLAMVQNVQTQPIQDCFERDSESRGRWNNFRGVTVYGASGCIPELGLVVIAEIEKQDVLIPIKNMFIVTIIILIFSIINIIIAALYFSKRLTQALSALSSTVQQITSKKGLLIGSIVESTSSTELAKLTSLFNLMLENIRMKENVNLELVNQLEKDKNLLNIRVKERTVELEQEKNKLARVTENMETGAILIDEKHKVIFANKKIYQMLNVSEEINVLPALFKLFSDASFAEQYMHSRAHAGLREYHMEREIKDVCYSILLKTLQPEHDDGHHGTLLLFQDITQEKILERSKTELIGIASHQFRTPLTTMRLNAELLLEGEGLSKDQKILIEDIEGSAIRLISMANSMLNITKMEGDELQYATENINICELLNKSINNHEQFAQSKNIIINKCKLKTPIWVDAEVEKLTISIANILENAIKYSRETGIIDISVNEKDEIIEIMIKDTGIGIPEAEKKHVFQKFYRASNAGDSSTEGSGFGLYVVKEYMTRMGGAIRFESEEGKGTTFYLILKKGVDQ